MNIAPDMLALAGSTPMVFLNRMAAGCSTRSAPPHSRVAQSRGGEVRFEQGCGI